MRITLKQLQAFDAVARLGSVSIAASSLSLSQSAVSMSISELEDRLTTPLFFREGRNLVLTGFGRELLPNVRDVLNKVQFIENLGQSDESALSGEIRASVSTTIANYLIPLKTGNFRKSAPNTRFNLRVGNTEKVINDLRHYQSDIGLIEGICNDSQIICEPWRKDHLVIIASPDHPFNSQKEVTFDDLLSQEWALRESGSGTRDIFEKAMRQYGGQKFFLKLAIELAHTEALKRIVQTTNYLSCISEFAIQREIERGDLVVLPTPYLDLERTLYLLVRAGQTLSPLMEKFREYCISQSAGNLKS